MTAEWTDHDCAFAEVEIGEADEDGVLRAGMKVLIPCECGETPHDHLGLLEMEWQQAGKALLAARPVMPLFHWSPRARRGQILRYGLRPWRPPTVSSIAAPSICFADSASWAWALSGEQRGAPKGEWDLWQTDLTRLDDPQVLASEDRMSGIHEVRTLSRVYKRDLWYVASREKR